MCEQVRGVECYFKVKPLLGEIFDKPRNLGHSWIETLLTLNH